jgi:uncharacterized membrane protein
LANSAGSSASDVRAALLDTYRSSALSFATLFLGFVAAVFAELTAFHDYDTSGFYTIPTYAITVTLGISAFYRGIWWSGLSHEALSIRFKETFEGDINPDSLSLMHDKFVKSMLEGKVLRILPRSIIFGSVLGVNLAVLTVSLVFSAFLFARDPILSSGGWWMIIFALVVGFASCYVWNKDVRNNKKKLGIES